MKKVLSIGIVCLMVFGLCFSDYSYAGDEGWAAAGGFLGGLLVGSAVNGGCYSGCSPTYYNYTPVYAYPVYSTYATRTYYSTPCCRTHYAPCRRRCYPRYQAPRPYYDYYW